MIIEKLNAVAANPTGHPVQVPANLDPRALVTVLSQIGLTIPSAISAGVAKNDLRDCGHRFSIKETDAAMAGANFSITDRIAIKTAMGRNNILQH